MPETFSLVGKTSLITGGTRGIGLALARGFADARSNVVICGRKRQTVDAALESLQAFGSRVQGMVADVASADDLERLVHDTAQSFGSIEVLVNNAGTNPYLGPIVDSDNWAWDKTFDVNLRGPYLLSRMVGRMMIDAGRGSVINVASVAGLEAAPMMGIYSVTKAGMIMLTRVLAREWGGHGVRVNCICPGLFKTDLSRALWSDDRRLQMFTARTALGRPGSVEELVGAAVYLASDASSYTTGAILQIDGGMVM